MKDSFSYRGAILWKIVMQISWNTVLQIFSTFNIIYNLFTSYLFFFVFAFFPLIFYRTDLLNAPNTLNFLHSQLHQGLRQPITARFNNQSAHRPEYSYPTDYILSVDSENNFSAGQCRDVSQQRQQFFSSRL